jgi:hypothetical protein
MEGGVRRLRLVEKGRGYLASLALTAASLAVRMSLRALVRSGLRGRFATVHSANSRKRRVSSSSWCCGTSEPTYKAPLTYEDGQLRPGASSPARARSRSELIVGIIESALKELEEEKEKAKR